MNIPYEITTANRSIWRMKQFWFCYFDGLHLRHQNSLKGAIEWRMKRLEGRFNLPESP